MVGHLAQTLVEKEGGICLRAPNESVAEPSRTQISGIFPHPRGSQTGFHMGLGLCSGPWLEGVPSCFLDLNADSSDFAHFTF